MGVEFRRCLDDERDTKITTPVATKPRHTSFGNDDPGSGLGAGRHLNSDGLSILGEVLAIGFQRVHGDLRPQRCGRHRDGDNHLEIVTVTGKDIMGTDRHLDIQVTGRTTSGTDFSLGIKMDAVAVSHSGGNLDVDRASGAYPPLTGTLLAGIRNDRTVTMAGRAGLAGADITKEGALHGNDLTAPLTGIAGHRLGTGLCALTLAFRAHHCGVDF